MNPPKDLIAPLDLLSALWQEKKIDWATKENLDKLEYDDPTFEADLARKLNIDILRKLQEMYKDAITFTISIGYLEILRLHSDIIQEGEIAEFQKNLTGSENVKLNLQINKKKLADIHFAQILSKIPEEKEYFLYLYEKPCEEHLANCNLKELENIFWKNNAKAKVVILLPNIDAYLNGAHLLILGGSHLTPEILITDFTKEKEFSVYTFDLCRQNLRWQEVGVKFLTPWHLYVEGNIEKNCLLEEILSMHFGNAALLYAADETLCKFVINQNCVSCFKSLDKQVEIAHMMKGERIKLLPEELKQVKVILEWIYDPQWKSSTSDRLTLAQQNIVDQLYNEEYDKRFLALFQKAESIRKNIEWHWETFTTKKIDTYFGVVKDYENYLSQVAQGFATDLAAIQKTLSDTLLAAVAVLIGSFIASLFKDPFNPSILQLGMTIYAIYIAAIPLGFNMTLQWKKYCSDQKQVDAQKMRISKSLPEGKVAEIWDAWKMNDLRIHFKRMFWVTVGIYVFVIILLLVPWLVPPEVLAGAVKSVIPTVTSTSLPTIMPSP